MASVLLGLSVEAVTGRGSGLSDEGLIRKQKAIEKAITEKMDKARQELEILRNLPHHAFEAELVYISAKCVEDYIAGIKK